MTAAGLALVALALLLLAPSAVQRVRRHLARRRLRAELLASLRYDLAQAREHVHYWMERSDKWETECRRVTAQTASLLEVIDDHHEAAAAEAMVQNPAYFASAAGRALAELDEQTWGRSS